MTNTNVNYTIEISIDNAKVIQFSKQNYKFCFASGVAPRENGDTTFNIVADTQGKGIKPRESNVLVP